MAGEPNIGKTALVQDIINGVNSGLSFWGEPLTDVRGKCIFVDLEQSDDLCIDRMQNAPEGLFKGILRIGVKYDGSDQDISVESLIPVLKGLMQKDKGPWFIVVDNMSNLIGTSSTERIAISLVKNLRKLIASYEASVLLVAHTTKSTASHKQIRMDHIRGSKILSGLVDSIFCICDSKLGEGICYIKHLKSKRSAKYHDVAEVELVESPFLHFRFLEWNEESCHIDMKRKRRKKYSEEEIKEVINLFKNGLSCREIEAEIGIPKSTVNKIINEYKAYETSSN
jgi:KaiC/GvpD/RAD55 family RecA-like ATPase